MAIVAIALTARTAGAQEEWYFRQPAPSRPQQLEGVIRPGTGEPAPYRVDSVRDVFALVRTCWRLAPRRLTYSGQELTIRMSFNRRGEIIGTPQITYYQSGGDLDERDVFVNSIMTALRLCTPLPFSEGLGAAVAGRPFTFRFIDSRPPQRSL